MPRRAAAAPRAARPAAGWSAPARAAQCLRPRASPRRNRTAAGKKARVMRPPAVCPLIAAHHHAGTAEAPCRLQGLRMPGRCEAHHSKRTATQANSQPHVQVYAGTGKAVPTRVDVAAHRPLPGPSNPSLPRGPEAAGGNQADLFWVSTDALPAIVISDSSFPPRASYPSFCTTDTAQLPCNNAGCRPSYTQPCPTFRQTALTARSRRGALWEAASFRSRPRI